MSIQLAVIICLVALITSFIREKNIVNPTAFFSLIWGLVFFFYIVNPYHFPLAGEENVNLMFIGVISFLIGSMILGDISIKRGKINFRLYKSHLSNKIINNNFGNPEIIFGLCILGSLLYCLLGFSGLKAILSGQNMAFIRYYLRAQTLDTGINGILLTYVAEPIMFFAIAYSIANANELINTIKGKLQLFLSLFMVLGDYLTTGGRLVLLFALVCVLCTIHLNNRSKGNLFFFIVMVIVFIFFILKAVIDRGGDIVKATITYIYAPVKTCDRYIDIFNSSQYHFTYGFLSLQGLTRIFFKIFGLSNISIIQNVDTVYKLIDSPIYIGTMRFNSSATFVGYFYFDFGLIGVIIGSALFGFASQQYYRYISEKKYIYLSDIIFYLILMGTISFSFIGFTLASPGYALSILLLAILKNKKFSFGKDFRNTDVRG